jgi:soluble lytic murein transglycosylase-like protein
MSEDRRGKQVRTQGTAKTIAIDISRLARDLEREIRSREKTLALPEQNLEIGTRHLMWMCRQVYSGWVPESLAPIWVGYVQGVLRVGGGPNVKEMAAMIRSARTGEEPEER